MLFFAYSYWLLATSCALLSRIFLTCYTIPSMGSLIERETLRHTLQGLLNERLPADALAVYYAFHHPVERTESFVYRSPDTHEVEGCLIRSRTGMDLFRPLVTLRATTETAVAQLVKMGLRPGWPVYLTIPVSLAPWVNKYLTVTDGELHHLYQLNLNRYQALINVLTVITNTAEGTPRCEIRAQVQMGEQVENRAGAVAGLNWQSPRFAEFYVYTDPAVRGRGWGKAVVATLAGLVLKSGRWPLYAVAEHNDYSLRLADAVGFDDTGHREYAGYAVLNP